MAIKKCPHREHGRLDTRQRVVHALPGRVRLRFPRCCADEARQVAWRFAAHPDVRQVSYREPSRSVVIEFNGDRSFGDILATLPATDGSSSIPALAPPGVNWGRVAATCLLSLLPLGPVGNVALTFATSLTEEVRRAQAIATLPGPAPRA